MNKIIKKIVSAGNSLRQLSRRSKIWLASVLLILLVLIYPVAQLLAVSPAEIKLAELKRSWTQETICHETCALAREQEEKVIVNGLQTNSYTKTSNLIKKYFFDESLSPEFRAELVRILGLAFGAANPPDYLRSYASAAEGQVVIQAAIINVFSPTALAGQTASADSASLDYYFAILASNRDLALRLAALRAISNQTDKAKSFSRGQLVIIKKLILAVKTADRLREELVLLLGDYYPLFPDETQAVLQLAYQTEIDNDVISKAFAADLLNHLAQAHLAIPPVSASAWRAYYNN
jgi:hypothetical protein